MKTPQAQLQMPSLAPRGQQPKRRTQLHASTSAPTPALPTPAAGFSAIRFLHDELVRRTRTNPATSLRSFARLLNLAPSALSEILRGKRPISLRSGIRIASRLQLSPRERAHFLDLIQTHVREQWNQAAGLGTTDASQQSTAAPTAFDLSASLFSTVSDWYCMAILNLADCKPFQWNPRWIAARLNLTETEVRSALDRLVAAGLLRQRGTLPYSRYEIVHQELHANTPIPSRAIREYHRQILTKAIEALDAQPMHTREIAGLGLAIDTARIDELKTEIRAFLKKMAKKHGATHRNRSAVYQLEIACFALTNQSKEGA